MFVVVLSTIFLDFAPPTAMMIVAMSLLDDVPIMTIAYDNTPVSAKPIRWHMPQLLSVAAVLGVFSIVETFGLLLIGIRVLSHPHLQDYFGLASEDQLRTVMFLQLVAGGHLLLFITRSERWFFLPPLPALPLFSAIVLTPDPGGADVRLRLARPVDPVDPDRMGVAIQHRLDVRARRRSAAE